MRRIAVLVAMAAGAALVLGSVSLAEGAQKTSRVTGEETLLRVDSGTASALSDAGFRIRPTGQAAGGGAVFSFPITGGGVATDPLSGTIRHAGGLRFAQGGDRLVVENFKVNLDGGVLTARVGGTDQRVPLLNLRGGELKGRGPVIVLEDVRGRLTPQAANALNATFGTDLFERGLLLGELEVIARTDS